MENEIKELKARNYDLIKEINRVKTLLKQEQQSKKELYDFWRANRYYNSEEFRNHSLDELSQMAGTDFLGSIAITDNNGGEYIFHGLIKVRKGKVWIGVQKNGKSIECDIKDVVWWKRATFDTIVFD